MYTTTQDDTIERKQRDAPLTHLEEKQAYSPCVFNPFGMSAKLCREISSAPLRAFRCGDCKSPFRAHGIMPVEDDGLPSVAKAFASLEPPAFPLPALDHAVRRLSDLSREEALAFAREIADRIEHREKPNTEGYFAIACELGLGSEYAARKLCALLSLDPGLLEQLDPSITPETPLTPQLAAMLTDLPPSTQAALAQRLRDGTIDENGIRRVAADYQKEMLMRRTSVGLAGKAHRGRLRKVVSHANEVHARAAGLVAAKFVSAKWPIEKEVLACLDEAIRIIKEESAVMLPDTAPEVHPRPVVPAGMGRSNARRSRYAFRKQCESLHKRICFMQERAAGFREKYIPQQELKEFAELLAMAAHDLAATREALTPPAKRR